MLAELLDAVAIIGVLVSISIPIFTSQLEKSREAVMVANVCSAYAQAASAYLVSNGKAVTDAGDGVTVAAPDTDGSVSVTVDHVAVKGTNNADLSNLETELPFTLSTDNIKALHQIAGEVGANGYVKITFKYAKNASEPTVASIVAGTK